MKRSIFHQDDIRISRTNIPPHSRTRVWLNAFAELSSTTHYGFRVAASPTFFFFLLRESTTNEKLTERGEIARACIFAKISISWQITSFNLQTARLSSPPSLSLSLSLSLSPFFLSLGNLVPTVYEKKRTRRGRETLHGEGSFVFDSRYAPVNRDLPLVIELTDTESQPRTAATAFPVISLLASNRL